MGFGAFMGIFTWVWDYIFSFLSDFSLTFSPRGRVLEKGWWWGVGNDLPKKLFLISTYVKIFTVLNMAHFSLDSSNLSFNSREQASILIRHVQQVVWQWWKLPCKARDTFSAATVARKPQRHHHTRLSLLLWYSVILTHVFIPLCIYPANTPPESTLCKSWREREMN